MLALLVVLLLVSQITATEDFSSLELWHKGKDGTFFDYDYDRNWGNSAKAARMDMTRENLAKRLINRIQNLARDIEDLAQQLKNLGELELKHL